MHNKWMFTHIDHGLGSLDCQELYPNDRVNSRASLSSSSPSKSTIFTISRNVCFWPQAESASVKEGSISASERTLQIDRTGVSNIHHAGETSNDLQWHPNS